MQGPTRPFRLPPIGAEPPPRSRPAALGTPRAAGCSPTPDPARAAPLAPPGLPCSRGPGIGVPGGAGRCQTVPGAAAPSGRGRDPRAPPLPPAAAARCPPTGRAAAGTNQAAAWL